MASVEGERKNGMMEGENFPIQCCQVSSHCVGCLPALFHVLFAREVLIIFVRNSHSKKKNTSDEIKVLCCYISEEHVAPIFRVTVTLR
jgi:uncharacterized protein (DUF111 family)